MTGSMPGMAASTRETWVLGAARNPVAAPENNLAFEATWAWTSRPMTMSHSPRPPAMAVSARAFRSSAMLGSMPYLARDGAARPCLEGSGHVGQAAWLHLPIWALALQCPLD